uniref:Uncharacterized protein n=1 Tax=Pygocentrus nattereri TaxID=42514 RepID=A0AAR2JPQ6_PYGNA
MKGDYLKECVRKRFTYWGRAPDRSGFSSLRSCFIALVTTPFTVLWLYECRMRTPLWSSPAFTLRSEGEPIHLSCKPFLSPILLSESD